MTKTNEEAQQLPSSFHINVGGSLIHLLLVKFSDNDTPDETERDPLRLYLTLPFFGIDGQIMMLKNISQSLTNVGLTAKNIVPLRSNDKQGFGSAVIEMSSSKDALFAVQEAKWLWIEGCVYPLKLKTVTDNKKRKNP